MIRNLVGLASLALIVAGIWGLWGWQWAAIIGALPFWVFYLWDQVRIVTSGAAPTEVAE